MSFIKFKKDKTFVSKKAGLHGAALREAVANAPHCSVSEGEILPIIEEACTNQVIAFAKDGIIYTWCRCCLKNEAEIIEEEYIELPFAECHNGF